MEIFSACKRTDSEGKKRVQKEKIVCFSSSLFAVCSCIFLFIIKKNLSLNNFPFFWVFPSDCLVIFNREIIFRSFFYSPFAGKNSSILSRCEFPFAFLSIHLPHSNSSHHPSVRPSRTSFFNFHHCCCIILKPKFISSPPLIKISVF